LYGLREDNNLKGQEYSWLGSILSLGVRFAQSSTHVLRSLHDQVSVWNVSFVLAHSPLPEREVSLLLLDRMVGVFAAHGSLP
jgi:hypothetical protein